MNAPVAALLVALWAVASDEAPARADVPPPGFSALFNGKDLTGWWGLSTEDPRNWMALRPAELQKKREESLKDVAEHWRVENGELVNDGRGLYLTTERNFRDFELWIDYKTVAKADSGIYLKGTPQVQIWDNPIGSGGLYNDNNQPRRNVDRPVGEWNSFVIIMRNGYVTVIENGVQVVDRVKMNSINGLPETGTIELQHHNSPLWFKDIYIRELPD